MVASLPLGLRGRFTLSLLVGVVGAMVAFQRWGSSVAAQRALLDFWVNDLAPLTGAMRIYIYTTLLMTAMLSHYARPHLGDSPLQAPELYGYTLPQFFSREGAMKLMHTTKWVNKPTLRAIRAMTVMAFGMCIVGAGLTTHTHDTNPTCACWLRCYVHP